VYSENDELNDALLAPLLQSSSPSPSPSPWSYNISSEAAEEEAGRGGAGIAGDEGSGVAASSSNGGGGGGGGGNVMGGFSTLETVSSPHTSQVLLPRACPRSVRWAIVRCLRVATVADKVLPGPLLEIVNHGKVAAAVLAATYLLFLVLWFPVYLLSYVLGEAGIYVMSIFATFFVGRSVIRLIAFPGASQRVTAEIETEFSKYCVKITIASCESLLEVASLVASAAPPSHDGSAPMNEAAPPRPQGVSRRLASGLYDMPVLWKRARTYRDRVLGVFHDVLLHLYSGGQSPEHRSTHSLSSSSAAAPDLTPFGNNLLLPSDDVGDLSGLTPQARADGRELLRQLGIVLGLVRDLERVARPVLEAGLGPNTANPLTAEAGSVARRLVDATRELRDFSASLRRGASSTNGGASGGDDDGIGGEEEEDLTVDAVRRRFEETSHMDAVRAGLASVVPMLDPPPHASIFGFDVLRGCVLSRYRGARQMWVPRPHGGRMDVLHFPAVSAAPTRNTKAVLYCNPNAGLIEVAAGMGLIGGNLPSAAESDGGEGSSSGVASSWTDFYTRHGLDVYVFNYAGYGRSYGTTLCVSGAKPGDHDYRPGFLPRLGRIVRSTFLTFTPRPDTLRSDGIAVALHLLNHLGVEQLVVHGESIGGVAASAAGRYLSSLPSTRGKVSLLVCDRTFCNLEAVAQRLVGGWSGYAIRALAPLWGTDVAGDFVASSVPKVVASDAADAIIDDAASLKSGVALWKEIRRGAARSTRDIAWMSDPPLQYRMADWENVCVADSRYVAGTSLLRPKPPTWPADRRITLDEAFHFAACCTRMGKLAKTTRSIIASDSEAGIEYDDRTGAVPSTNVLFEAWKTVACCDGLTGAPLGVAVKRGFDATVAWLCSSVVYGGQVVATRAYARCKASNSSLNVTDHDFDQRPPDYEADESGEKIHPKPLPQVVQSLNYFLETADESLRPRTLLL
jgi:hypothetical protein